MEAGRHQPVAAEDDADHGPERAVRHAKLARHRGDGDRDEGHAQREREEHLGGLPHGDEQRAEDHTERAHDPGPGKPDAFAEQPPDAQRRDDQGGYAEGDPAPVRLALAFALAVVGQLADSRDDVDVARLEGGEDNGDEGQNNAQAVADDDGCGRDLHLDEGEVVASGSLEEDIDEQPRGEDPGRDANHAGEQRVGHPFGEEGLHDVSALGADRTGHAHFGAALGREHHEDHEDEHHAGSHREETEDEEERGHDVADHFGFFDAVLLGVIDAEGLRVAPVDGRAEHTGAVAAEVFGDAFRCRVSKIERVVDAAMEGNGERSYLVALETGNRPQAVHREDKAPGDVRVGHAEHAGGDFVLHDARYHHVRPGPGDSDDQWIAGAGVEVLRSPFAEEDAAIAEVVRVSGAAIFEGEPACTRQALEVDTGELDGRLRIAGADVRDRRGNREEGQECVDCRVGAETGFEGVDAGFVGIDDRALVHCALVEAEVAFAVPGDVEVRAPEDGVDVLRERMVDGVAGDEGGGSDERRQGEPGNDEE